MALFTFNGKALRQKRLAAGLTVAELADAAGRSPASIQHYQSGFAVPSTPALLALCEALRVEPGQLFSRVEEKENIMT